ncbi:MAG TPA: LuxR C-terminal-related transcriptional regulator [Ramlibacter sp.]|uniref:helix-turn-helix transcriptional regulator n=1 Tax=Ramlibacter sp. TaxID=1917967 RepID=UPI002C77AB4E|nr:LuxR C-terminal-related transcriptional regulator [Ramlibacter sp.]HVZ45739.1 LuxR C-terminal-related transcriptional regulator [Ramlibacter sp.]
MRTWTSLDRGVEARLSLDWIESLARSVGEPAWARAMIDALNHFALVDHCAMFLRLRGAELRLLAASSRVAHSRGARAALRYMDGMNRYDEGREPPPAARGTAGESVVLKYRTREEVPNERYRVECYDETGIEDRLTMSRLRADGTAALLHCYRDTSTGRFTEAELDSLTAASPLLLSFVDAHARLALPRAIPVARWRETLDHNAGAPLSARELDVCANLLSGATLGDTAEALGLSINTVITYSRRAYAKFGVGSVRELHDLLVSS